MLDAPLHRQQRLLQNRPETEIEVHRRLPVVVEVGGDQLNVEPSNG
ncbi:MAG: hypothetical protein M3143_12130 [Actinomycetota bacterium]|nr:hypothetical protein [Actinomycetota bacterium]